MGLSDMAMEVVHLATPRGGMLHMVMIGTLHTIPVPVNAWSRGAGRVLHERVIDRARAFVLSLGEAWAHPE